MNFRNETLKIFSDSALFKFIIVGVINTLIGASIMFLLYNLAGVGYWISSAANYAIGSVVSFFLNKYFTFRVKQWSAWIVIAYIITIAVAYLAAYSAAKPAVAYFLRNYSEKVRGNISLFAGMCLFTGLNYIGQRFFVFKKNTTEE